MAKIPPGILAWITLVLVESTIAGAPEYAAAESKKHVGEPARVARPADVKELPAGTNILGSPAEPGIADVTALVEFTGNGATNKGSRPNGLIFASDGDIYGTTEYGGDNDYGTVFKMTPAGALSTIVEFAGNAPVNSSGFPMAPLTERRDGDFYGTTSGGGVGPTGENNLDNGTIFKLSRSGILTTLVRFSCNGATNKGCTPYSELVEAPSGDFYGTTFSGGSGKAVPIPGFRGFGTIYKMSLAGQLTTLYDFSGHVAKGQGGAPWAGLTLGKDRNFYGNTWLGGAGHAGTIFKITPRGAMTTLVNFSGLKPPNKGGGCVAGLVQASDGNFYGTCPIGGGGNGGTVFKITPSGAFTNLVEFSNNDPKGALPHAALAEGNDGNFYGTTTVGGAYNYGTIFRVTPGGSFKVLWNFNNPNKIHECQHPGTGPLLKDKEGNFYGTTKWGGRSDWGTVFKLTLHNSDMQASTAPPVDSPSRAMSQPAQMEKARAEIEAGAKKIIVTQPSIQAVQNEQSSTKDKGEVSSESIAEAFVQAYSGADVDAVARFYADRVDYTNSGVITNAAIRKQAQEYFARWPARQWSLAGPVKTTSMGPSRQKVIFSASYDASNPQTNKHASGVATETLIVANDASGGVKIVSQKEQTSKRGSGQSGGSGKKTLEDGNFEAAKTEYDTGSQDEAARLRYVTKLADIYYQFLQNEWANGPKRELEGGDLVFEELTKHPAPANSDSKKLSQLLIGEWAAERHGNPYDFRADGKWGRSGSSLDDYWQIKGNQFFARDATGKIDEGGTIILLNDDYFIYSDGNGYVTFYSSIRKALADAKRNQNQSETAAGEKMSDSEIKQKLLGYWSSPRHGYHIASDGIIYMCPRKYATTTNHWKVKDGTFYWDNLPHTIVTLTDKKFVYGEIGGHRNTATLIRGTKEEVDPD